MRVTLLFAAFVGCVVGANFALTRWGIVPIGFGLMAPAGVYFAGLSFTIRDGLREEHGRGWSFAAIGAGALLSFFLEDAQRIAIASGVAFGFSETADALVYEPLRGRSKLAAVALSNTVGAIVDSALFLFIAFGSLAFIEGQVIGKMYMTLPFAIGIVGWHHRDLFVRLYRPAA